METLFGKRKNRPRESSIIAQDHNDRLRPLSGASVATTTTRSDSTRSSRYAASTISPSEPHHHLSQLYKHQSATDEFYFPRPQDNEEIEGLFQNILRMRGYDNLLPLSIEQKWHMVYNDEHMRWQEERRRDGQSRKQPDSSQTAAFSEGSPEWYIKKFMDRTISPKQASSLQISLRSGEMRYVYYFAGRNNAARRGARRPSRALPLSVGLARGRPCLLVTRRSGSRRSHSVHTRRRIVLKTRYPWCPQIHLPTMDRFAAGSGILSRCKEPPFSGKHCRPLVAKAFSGTFFTNLVSNLVFTVV